MRRAFQIAVAAIFPIIAIAGQAKAQTCVLPSSFSGTFIWNNNGTVSPEASPTTICTVIQQQDKDWSGFAIGSTLPAGSLMQFAFSHVVGTDEHTLSFLDDFGTIGGTFSWGYDISVVPGDNAILTGVTAGILQTVGTASLTKVLVDNNSNIYNNIDFSETGTIVTGPTSSIFMPHTTMLAVTETLTISPLTGSDVTGVSNSFTERLAVPEPSTWAMMVLGFAGLGFAGCRKARRTDVVAA
jgi:hypothetical protein